MRITTALVSVTLIVAALPVRAQERSRNGYWWNGQSQTYKLDFIEGYTEAMVDAAGVTCSRDGFLKDCLKDPSAAGFDFTNIPMGQLMEGVDAFYTDFRNKAIDISGALDYVRRQLKGESPAVLERVLKALRNLQANPK